MINNVDIKIIDASLDKLSIDNTIAKELIASYSFKCDKFKVQIETGDLRLLMITWKIEILANHQNADRDSIKLETTIGTVFKINNIDIVLGLADHKIQNAELMLSIFDLSYSTARGLIDSVAKGTAFHGALLPLVDPMKLVSGFEELVKVDVLYQR
ncbi:hypothetical protein [Dyadobacter arcticus]|uniref:SCP2 domain-containing protein n=1 Tax=Dyadobacter arcticus TaxID=1078754 RepID=A0ABX0UHQ8_9BACT|nr:hypothetical protein [Dyadobacter arcticus]NIJ52452.1 hypothetical protein [Dyadobacter arcticus]